MRNRVLLCLMLVLLAACGRDDARRAEPVERDWPRIQARDTLVVLFANNSTTYFLYRGEPVGYEYDLLRRFAADHEIHLRAEVVADEAELLERLNRGDGDVAAARLVPRMVDADWVAFTDELYRTAPVLVQRGAPPSAIDLPEVVDTVVGAAAAERLRPAGEEIPVRLVAQPGELAGETVHVGVASAFLDRLIEIQDSITGDIHIVEVGGGVRNETLIRQVARGEIDLTVAPENLASLRQGYFTNIAVQPVIGPEFRVAWGVRRNAPELLGALNAWLAAQREAGTLDQAYARYFEERRGLRARVDTEPLEGPVGRLSAYDELLRENAQRIGWDWRLLASLTYQESEFNPRARSWAGAQGLMQLMPGTARDLRVADVWDPAQNIRGGTTFLRDLATRWEPDIPDPAERLKFVLASYNVGPGHVYDAQRLTEAHGGNRLVWDEVAYWLLQKSRREVYTHPVVRHGYARGLEPVTYVAKILERYTHYSQLVVPAEPAAAPR